ncbi:hypothetical protein ACS0TY_029071 [Phlomoides rotata]
MVFSFRISFRGHHFMAEEKGLDSGIRSRNPPGNPGATLSKGRATLAHHRRAPVGSNHAKDSLLRNSAEKSHSADTSKKNVVPHYLRASTGSCHDLCKYGREHSFEKKERKPLRKRVPNEPFVEILLSDKQKKEKPSTDTKNHSSDRKPSRDTKSYTPKLTASLDRGKETMQHKPSKDTKNRSLDMPSAKSYTRNTKVLSDVKPYSRKENGSSGSKTLTAKKPTKRIPSADPPEIVKGVIFPSTEVEVSVKSTSTDKKLSKKTTNVSQPHSSPVKSKPISAYSNNSDGIRGKGIRNGSAKASKKVTSSKAPVKKVLLAPSATLSPKLSVNKIAWNNSGKAGNLKLVSSVKDQNKPERVVKTEESNDEKVSEKTLHVIEMETMNDVSESTPGGEYISKPPSISSAESFSFADSSSLSSHEGDNAQTEQSSGEADEVKVPPVKENHNKTLRKSREVVSEDKCRKLKFRSGKVVDVQLDTNRPRRLRFRRGRVLGAQDSKGDTRKALKKAAAKDDTKGAEVSPVKVVLKHQDVQDKKDAGGLFNNVIEETASKLVESRKSKVKALVGAFETVISLQETKPSSPSRLIGQ